MLVENFFLGHPMSQPAENIIHGNPHPANAWLTVPLIGFNGNAWVQRSHTSNLIIAHFHRAHLPTGCRNACICPSSTATPGSRATTAE